MESCSPHHWILFFIILIPVADQTVTYLTAKLHHPVTLTCNQKCSGEMTWKKVDGYVVAYCDQTSCRSGDGFEISHDQYLKGNLTLVIRSADYSKRTLYTCYCDDKPVCDVHLTIEPWVSAVQKKPGEDLVLDLTTSDPTEVVYEGKDTADLQSELICSVTDDPLQCGTVYKQRASLHHTELTLRDLKVSDSGVYTIRDMKNKEVLHTYVVSVVEDCQPEDCTIWKVLVGLLLLLLPLVWIGFILFKWRKKLNMPRISNLKKSDTEEKQTEGLRGTGRDQKEQMEDLF